MTAHDLRNLGHHGSDRVYPGGIKESVMEEKWYVFNIVTRVTADTETDAFRLLAPALETLQKLDVVRFPPIVELLKEDEPHDGHRIPLPIVEVPEQYGIS
jgi:hypothetical protein